MSKRDEMAKVYVSTRLWLSGNSVLSGAALDAHKAGWDAREEQIKVKACPDCWEQMKPYPTTDDLFVCEPCGSKWRKAALVTVRAQADKPTPSDRGTG